MCMCIFHDFSDGVSVRSKEVRDFSVQMIGIMLLSWLLYWHGLQKDKKFLKLPKPVAPFMISVMRMASCDLGEKKIKVGIKTMMLEVR